MSAVVEPAAAAPVVWNGPGVYALPTDEYHADELVPGGSLSSTGARRLLPPSCPAIFAYEREHGQPDKRTYDIGHAVHDAMLGGGPEIVSVPADNWLTKAAKAQRDEIRARGAVPLLAEEYETVQTIARTVLEHPIAGRLFQPGTGTPEASLYARDEQTGVMMRGRLDWLPEPVQGRRFIIPDLKSAKSAEPSEFMKSVASYGYFAQADWYCSLVRTLGIAEAPVFVFVVVEKTPPYVVSVIQPDITAMRIGALRNRQALDLYAKCEAEGRWPGYVEDVALGVLPYWFEKQYESELS